LPRIIRTTPANAELIKYANNAFLAMKISYINSIANLCQVIPRADVEVVASGIGIDRRIGQLFLKAGLGWGGSCFPKDLKALSGFGKSIGVDLHLVEATLRVNNLQPLNAVRLAERLLGDLGGKLIALLGLSFKAGTDDMRDAVSIKIIDELLGRGAKVVAYDPVAMPNAQRILRGRIQLSPSALDCVKGADCCIVVTEWKEFARTRPEEFISRMRRPIVIDGRRIFNPSLFSKKLRYAAIGLGPNE
jgi:UDPglucose 6-dehydrogenase